MNIALIVAMAASNRVIGRDNKLPWYLPEDLQYFKRITMGKPMVMGRKTFESIGQALPGRANIVITRQPDYQAEGIQPVHSLEEGLELAKSIAASDGCEEIMVVGGGEIFSKTLPIAQRLYLTEVYGEFEGDAFFPEFDQSEWQQVSRKDVMAEGYNPYDYAYLVLDRKMAAA